MWSTTVHIITKFEIILLFTALIIWAEKVLYNLCRWNIFRGMSESAAIKGLIALNAFILICAVFWSGVWVF